jgi:hypothetical protein
VCLEIKTNRGLKPSLTLTTTAVTKTPNSQNPDKQNRYSADKITKPINFLINPNITLQKQSLSLRSITTVTISPSTSSITNNPVPNTTQEKN